MPDKIAEQILEEWKREQADSSQMMSLYQQIANHFYPRHNSITSTSTPGEDKSLPIIDSSGLRAADKMAAGLSAVVLPSGQYFCRLIAADDEMNDNEEVRSYLARATQILHQQIYKSNFAAQFNEYLRSLTTFGTANIFSEFDTDRFQLRFKNWGVANFRFAVDAYDHPNQCWIQWKYTAEQAYGLYGDRCGQEILSKLADGNINARQEKYPFIYRVRPRSGRMGGRADVSNYPFELTCVNEREKVIVFEGGYEQFPYHITRWLRGDDGEKWGYGQGAVALSHSKELQRQRKSLLLSADLANQPPMQVDPSFEGKPKVYPGALNRVMTMDTIKALDTRLHGNFPITRETIEMVKDDINDCFYIKVFQPLEGLPGDRRTTVEIIERVKAGYMQLVQPVQHLYDEGMTPCIERSVLLLLKYRVLPPPPPQLREFKVEYLGRLALALQEQQSDALIRFGQFAMQMEQVIPHFTEDNIHVDRAGRRMATTFGVNEGDLTTEEERAMIRQQRQQLQQQQMAMQAAMAAGSAYKDGSKAAEPGSPAEAMMAGMG